MNKMIFIFSRVLVLVALITITSTANTQSNWKKLFDGKTLRGWQPVAGTAGYEVKDGAIVGTSVLGSPNSFLISEETFGDFVLELQVKIEDTTQNSGIQFRSNYDAAGRNGKGEVFGYQYELDPSSRRWTGGIYEEARRGWLYPLSLNPAAQNAYKHGEFNKVRIVCRGNEVTTYVNGTPAAYLVDTVARKGLIALQVHSISNEREAGKKIYWKDIRISTGDIKTPEWGTGFIVNTNLNQLSAAEKERGWKLLFDGQSSSGWKGAYKPGFPEKGWVIKDGTLTVLPSGGGESTNGGDIVTTSQYSAFDLSFEFKLTPGANSGLKYFVTLKENNPGSAIGLEYQLLDDTLHPDAKMGREGNRTLASLYDLIKADKQTRFINQPGKWNTGRIVVTRDNNVIHYLNGVKVLEYKRGSKEYRDLVAISKYKVWPQFGEAPSGYILLQDHGNEVSFRSIKIREL